MRETIARVARLPTSILLTGESGTGKEVAARSIHSLSDRADKPFVPVNCAAIPPEMIEAELFGHIKGAFTGADSGREGLFLYAHGGTLFLDEIANVPLSQQAAQRLRMRTGISRQRRSGAGHRLGNARRRRQR